ncbi:adhesion G-protein coupled receptor G7-like isoform X2 [Clavelina lepadiformis]|uniref:adhesion G-protein coupled receptor G7-like isoform X2 n=1 Tax=Clavelina lepadiformis TaxID=159417 RepID=UPI004042F98E
MECQVIIPKQLSLIGFLFATKLVQIYADTPIAPEIASISNIRSSQFNVSWTHLDKGATTKYRVDYSPMDEGSGGGFRETTDATETSLVIHTNVEANTEYSITVVAIVSSTAESVSSPVWVATDDWTIKRTSPKKPTNVAVSHVRTSSLEVDRKHLDIKSMTTKHLIYYTDEMGSTEVLETAEESALEKSLKIKNLSANTVHTIGVAAVVIDEGREDDAGDVLSDESAASSSMTTEKSQALKPETELFGEGSSFGSGEDTSTSDFKTSSPGSTDSTASFHATSASTSAPCISSCAGCESCHHDEMGDCVCKCFIGYKPTNGKCSPLFCTTQTLDYPNNEDEIKVTFPDTQAGYQSSSIDKCPEDTSNAGKPYGTASCSIEGTWLQPKWLSSCNTAAESFINATFNSTEERQEAADTLEILTSDPGNLTSDDVSSTVEALNNVVDAETLDQNTSSAVVATVGNLLSVPEEELQLSGQAENLISTLDSVGEKIELSDGEEYEEVSSTVAIAVVQPTLQDAESDIGYQFTSFSIPDELGFRSDQLSTFINESSKTASSYIKVPPSARQQGSDNRVSFYAFPDDKLLRVTSTSETSSLTNNFIGSEVVLSATVVNATRAIADLIEPVMMRFSFTSIVTSDKNLEGKCVFWNETGSGFWSVEGLLKQNITAESAECQFNHLTNFATLFSTTSVNTLELDLITIIGSSVSIFSLVSLLGAYAFVKKMRSAKKFRSAFLLVNLAMALLVLNISLILSEQSFLQTSTTWCMVVAVIIHFSLLASLAWMMVEGVNIYVAVVHPLYTRTELTNLMVIIPSILWGWLMPAIFVAVVAGVDINNYTRNDAECWLRVDQELYLIIIPAAVMLGVNLILYIVILANVFCRRRPTLYSKQQSEIRKNFGLSVTLFVTIGGTWLIAFPMTGLETTNKDVSLAIAYVFSILTALQGFFLFVLFVVRQYFTVDLFKEFARKAYSGLTSTLSLASGVAINFRIPRPDMSARTSTNEVKTTST